MAKRDSKNTQMLQACIMNQFLQKIVFDLFIAPHIVLGIFIQFFAKAVTFLTQYPMENRSLW